MEADQPLDGLVQGVALPVFDEIALVVLGMGATERVVAVDPLLGDGQRTATDIHCVDGKRVGGDAGFDESDGHGIRLFAGRTGYAQQLEGLAGMRFIEGGSIVAQGNEGRLVTEKPGLIDRNLFNQFVQFRRGGLD